MSVVNLTHQAKETKNFIDRVIAESGEDISNCYQCGKCSAGCPIAFAMDIRPNRVIRMLQMGYKDELLNSRAIWLCATCSTCTSRCPRNVDLAKIMDTLRVIANQEGKTQQAKSAALMHKTFMSSIIKHGKIYELGLATRMYLADPASLFRDTGMGLSMFLKGKLSILPPKVKGAGEIKKIVENCKKMEGDH